MQCYCSEERKVRLQVGAQDTHLTWMCKYAAVSHIWSSCSSTCPCRCRCIAVKRQIGRTSPVKLALVTQAVSQLEELVLKRRGSTLQKAEAGHSTLWATRATAASHLTLVRRKKKWKKETASNLKDDDSVQENTLRQMVFALKNRGCPVEEVRIGFWKVTVQNECELQEERNSSEH